MTHIDSTYGSTFIYEHTDIDYMCTYEFHMQTHNSVMKISNGNFIELKPRI